MHAFNDLKKKMRAFELCLIMGYPSKAVHPPHIEELGIPDYIKLLCWNSGFFFCLSSYSSMTNSHIFLGIPDKFCRMLFLYTLFPYYSWNSSQFLLEWCSSMLCFLIFPWNSEIFSSLNMIPLCPIFLFVFGIPEKYWSNFSFLYEGIAQVSGIA